MVKSNKLGIALLPLAIQLILSFISSASGAPAALEDTLNFSNPDDAEEFWGDDFPPISYRQRQHRNPGTLELRADDVGTRRKASSQEVTDFRTDFETTTESTEREESSKVKSDSSGDASVETPQANDKREERGEDKQSVEKDGGLVKISKINEGSDSVKSSKIEGEPVKSSKVEGKPTKSSKIESGSVEQSKSDENLQQTTKKDADTLSSIVDDKISFIITTTESAKESTTKNDDSDEESTTKSIEGVRSTVKTIDSNEITDKSSRESVEVTENSRVEPEITTVLTVVSSEEKDNKNDTSSSEENKDVVVTKAVVDVLYDNEDEIDQEVAVSPRAPKIIGNLEENVVLLDEGENVTLTCRIVGFPTPKVIWTQAESENIGRAQPGVMNSDENDHSILAQLFISEVNCDDVGAYSCVGGNFLGKTKKSFLLDVTSCNQDGTTAVDFSLTKVTQGVV